MINRIKLSDAWQKKLADLPESGMGFQDVVVTTKDGRTIDGFVHNGEFLETVFAVKEDEIADIKMI